MEAKVTTRFKCQGCGQLVEPTQYHPSACCESFTAGYEEASKRDWEQNVQAGYKAGIREVVEWIDKNVCYPYPVGSSGYIKWQKQRKKWGIK